MVLLRDTTRKGSTDTLFAYFIVGLPERTSYAASKFAVQGYCEALRGELASSGVTVHVASPGYIRTNLSRSALTGDGTPHGKMDSATASGESYLDDSAQLSEKP